MNKPVQRKVKKQNGDCFDCEHCQYHSEGDSYCDYEEPIFVLEDWMPTEDFRWCEGKHFLRR